MIPEKRTNLIIYPFIIVLLSVVTVSTVIAAACVTGVVSSCLSIISYTTEPTHAIILTLVVRDIVDSSRNIRIDVGQVTQLSKKKAPVSQDRDNIYTVASPETILASSKLGTSKVTDLVVMESQVTTQGGFQSVISE